MKHNHTSKKRLFCLLLTACLLLGSLSALAAGQSPEGFVQLVAAQVRKHWPLMDTAWPGADYKAHNLLLFYVGDEGLAKEAWLINAQEVRKLAAADYAGIEAPLPGGYSADTVQGKPSIVMSFDDFSLAQPGEDVQTYRTATHELVHFYHQGELDQQPQGSRAQAWPVEAAPRYYRLMLYHNLLSALETTGFEGPFLAQARYWLDRWQKEYPAEAQAIRTTDIAEGTARYLENLGAVVGDKLQGESYLKALSQDIDKDILFAAADEESYELGFVAGLLLDRLQAGWKTDFYKKGQSPVELLLAPVQAAEQADSAEVKQRVEEEAAAVNKMVGTQVQEVLKAQADKAVPYLKINVTAASSSYEAKGNYLVGGDDVVTGFAAMYKAGAGSLQIRNTSVLMQADEAGQMYFILPLTMAHEVKDGVLGIQTGDVIVNNVPVEASTQEDGRTVYLAVADS